jgi:UDP:flavonoid glycosyltransferase YjiC (YdhE family)
MAVHHAGLGSTAAGLASGIPQFHVPCNMDQPDNAQRCKYLGVSDSAKPAAFRAERVLPAFQRLLSDPLVTARCRELANIPQSFDGLRRASEVLERLP